MTKAKAFREMLEYSRAIVSPEKAQEWAKAFSTTLEKLGVVIKSTEKFGRVTPFSLEDAKKDGVATCHLAQALVETLTDKEPTKGIFHGVGRNAEWITEGCVNILRQAYKAKSKSKLPNPNDIIRKHLGF